MSATNGTYICLLLFRFQCLILTYMFIYVHKYSQAFMFDCKKIKVKFHIFMCLYVIHERIHVIKFDLLISSFLICWFEIRLLSPASSVWMEIINIQSATQTLGLCAENTKIIIKSFLGLIKLCLCGPPDMNVY